MVRPRVLTIAGSDSSGGAGIEADLKVLTAHGVYGLTAITALTAQNTQGVQDVHQTPIPFLQKAIKAVVEDVGVDVVKTGMLPSKECIKLVCETIDRYEVERIVVDPVMISTSGHNLIPADAIYSLINDLLPRTFLLTPNVPEARKLVGAENNLREIDDIVRLGQQVQKLGPKWVLLKGGHCPLDKDWKVTKDEHNAVHSIDLLIGKNEVIKIPGPWIQSNNVHGTGCGLASAIAANLAKGKSVSDAVLAGTTYISNCISAVTVADKQLGHGNGPVDFAYGIVGPRPFAPGGLLHHLKTTKPMSDLWYQYTHHPFVEQVKDNTLPLTAFKRYLAQDYLYLTHYARALSLQAYRSKTFESILQTSGALELVKHEIDRNLKINAEFDVTEADIKSQEESLACIAYSRFLVDVAATESPVVLLAAFMPCLYGYLEIARRIVSGGFKGREVYRNWAETYAADDYAEAIGVAEQELEDAAMRAGVEELERCEWAFRQATKLEIEFWTEPLQYAQPHPEFN